MLHVLTRSLRRLDPAVPDTALAVVLATLFVLQMRHGATAAVGVREADQFAYVLALLATLPVAFRRRFPLPVLLVTAAGMGGYLAWGYPNPLTGMGMLVALYTVVSRCGRPAAVLGAVAAVAVIATGAIRMGGEYGWQGISLDLLVMVVAWTVGDATRSRRLHNAELVERARYLELGREQEAQRAVAAERVRIARELHDVVAHGMSVIAVQAGVGHHVIDTDPETARRALAVIETTSRDALAEMRRLLGVLRVDPDAMTPSERLDPQPGLENLENLVVRVRAAGVPVDLRIDGPAHELPPSVDLSAYRIVQESLTNVLKHAGPARVTVTLTYKPDGLVIEVVDDGRGPVGGRSAASTGHGLIGMRERVAVFGGSLHVGPLDGDGFRVAAWLPVVGSAQASGALA